MTHPLRENLEVYTGSNDSWIRCARCQHTLCRADEDWRAACDRRLLTPTAVGLLMKDLVGQFLAEELCCPSCSVLLNTDLVEVGIAKSGSGRTKQA